MTYDFAPFARLAAHFRARLFRATDIPLLDDHLRMDIGLPPLPRDTPRLSPFLRTYG